MALDIPMPQLPGDAYLKGLEGGSNLIHKMMLNKYYGEIHPSGDVANALYVEQLGKMYGVDDPRYLQAKRAHDLVLQGRESLMTYRDTLNQTAGARATSPLGKEINEGQGNGAQDILNRNRNGGTGKAPAPLPPRTTPNPAIKYDANGNFVDYNNEPDKNPRTPEEREAYERSINKKTSDPKTRDILLRAENLDKTRKAINKKALTQYSGPTGTLKWLGDVAQQAMGNPSKDYLDYTTSASSATLMADQMRQFYGDSIQPSAMDRLRHLTNPSTWYKDPQVAEAELNQLDKILDTETETYRRSGTSPIHLNKLEYKDGKFVIGKASAGSAPAQKAVVSDKGNPGGSYDMKAAIPQLMAINPKYTEANIRATAKMRKTTVDDIINQLFQKHAGAQ